MIFTECTENNEIVINEFFKPLTVEEQLKEREKAYKNTITLMKTDVDKNNKYFKQFCYMWLEFGSVNDIIRKYFKLNNNKSDLDDFLTGKKDSVIIGYINLKSIINKDMGYDAIMFTSRALYNGKTKIIQDELPKKYKISFNGQPLEEEISVILKAPKINNITGKKESTVLSFSGNNGGSYMHDALYESYVQAKIDSEDRLAFALKEAMVISESDYSNIRAIQEAKISDKIKAKWQNFVAFIKNMVAKFLESMSNLLLDEKDYLEKYKDIILKKKPKDDMEYSYTGNYEKGIGRIINTSIPVFNYATFKNELEAEGDGPLINKIMPGEFSYVDGDTLDEQLKSFFLALEDGQKTGKFSELNMTDIYNFCYNFNKVKGIVDKDISRLEASTKAIESEINKQLSATNANTQPTTNAQTTTTTTVQNNSAIFTEAEENKDNKESGKTGLNISTDPTSKMQNKEISDEDKKTAADQGANAAKDSNAETDQITKAADKWISVCRPVIAAKLTACQQIAKDYMEIIRAHVRSYGGTDKKDKSGNTAPKKGTGYSKEDSDNKNAEQSDEVKQAEQENQEADAKLKQAKSGKKVFGKK